MRPSDCLLDSRYCGCIWCRDRSRRKKERFKRETQNRRHRMYGHMDEQQKLERAFMNAAFHSKAVINRTVVSERKHRIGEFVTCLRRELRDMGKARSYDYLCDKDNWADILDFRGFNEPNEAVKSAIAAARREILNQDSPRYIENGLKSVDRQVDHAMSLLKDIHTINDEADEVLNGFKELAANMQG